MVGVAIAGALTFRYFGLPFEPLRVLKAILASVAIYLLMSLPSDYSLVALPFACIGALGVYAGLMLATRGITVGEITSLFKRETVAAPPIEEEVR